MPQSFFTMKATSGLVISSANLVLTGLSAVAINEQLNVPHEFLHMSLPLWWFFVFTFILSAIGAIASYWTDTMQNTTHNKFGNLMMGFVLGVIGAFILLPAFTSNPSVGLMMITGLAFSFSGTVLLHNLGEVLRSKELSDGVQGTATEAGSAIKKRLIAVLKAFIGGGN